MTAAAGAIIPANVFSSSSTCFFDFKKSLKINQPQIQNTFTVGRIFCSSSTPDPYSTTGILERSGNDGTLTGEAYDFEKATTSLTHKQLSSPKKVTLVRHGLSTWNEEGRVQGSSNLSTLTEIGVIQAEKCRKALSDLHFDCCFSSPISRAKSTAEIIWQDRDQPLIFLDSLKEAHLFFLEGMKNGQWMLRKSIQKSIRVGEKILVISV